MVAPKGSARIHEVGHGRAQEQIMIPSASENQQCATGLEFFAQLRKRSFSTESAVKLPLAIRRDIQVVGQSRRLTRAKRTTAM
jgi:hypothetical protein